MFFVRDLLKGKIIVNTLDDIIEVYTTLNKQTEMEIISINNQSHGRTSDKQYELEMKIIYDRKIITQITIQYGDNNQYNENTKWFL